MFFLDIHLSAHTEDFILIKNLLQTFSPVSVGILDIRAYNKNKSSMAKKTLSSVRAKTLTKRRKRKTIQAISKLLALHINTAIQ